MDQTIQPIRLNIGCGNKKIPHFINVDSRSDINPDVVCDITELEKKFGPNTVDEIYACHVLEHIHKDFINKTIMSWASVLKPEGLLKISVPDFDAAITYYRLTGKLDSIQALLHGGQKYPEDVHYSTWNFEKLFGILFSNGFNSIEKWDWRKTDHAYIDDYSQAYLPHMDKTHGMLMSLNIKAKKRIQ